MYFTWCLVFLAARNDFPFPFLHVIVFYVGKIVECLCLSVVGLLDYANMVPTSCKATETENLSEEVSLFSLLLIDL